MPIKPYLVLDGGIDCEKTGGPAKQVERRGRTKSGPIDPYALRARGRTFGCGFAALCLCGESHGWSG